MLYVASIIVFNATFECLKLEDSMITFASVNISIFEFSMFIGV